MDVGGVRFGGIDPSLFQEGASGMAMDGLKNLPKEAGAPGVWDTKKALDLLGKTGIPIPAVIERRAEDGSYPLSGNFHGEDPTNVLSIIIDEIGRRS